MSSKLPWARLSALCSLFGLLSPAHADEGMWPYDLAPVEAVKARYGFEMSAAWRQRAQRASVRFNNGGSGSFVSPTGLVMTNHHVGSDCIQKLSQGGTDYMAEGFVAADQAAELRCPDLELNQLISTEDVSAQINAATQDLPDEEAVKARRAKIAELEKTCAEQTKLRCDVVTLYGGGAYHLYRYQRYTDVRLVFAPDFKAAFFGGDPDNFTYPRTCFDVAFFRAYTDGKPAQSEAYFPFSAQGAQKDSLVFVSGHPGRTSRLSTPAELRFLRDTAYPWILTYLKEESDALRALMAKGPEHEKAARDLYFSVSNSLKALGGYHTGLKRPEVFQQLEQRHAQVQAWLAQQPPAQRARFEGAWPALESAFREYAQFYEAYQVTEGRPAPGGRILTTARLLLRDAEEREKPNEARMREFADAGRESLRLRLLSPAPIHDELELLLIQRGLARMQKVFGPDHPAVQAALGGLSPEARARAVLKSTALRDVAARERLSKLDLKALLAQNDPAIALVASYDALAREQRARQVSQVDAVQQRWSGRIAEAFAKSAGTQTYPDATFTLRLSVGQVKGYTEQMPQGQPQERAWTTTIADLFAKHDQAKGEGDYALHERWLRARDQLDLSTPYNFVSTNDTIGGNSGSPVFDQRGHAVGLIFDSNQHRLVNNFLYTEDAARAISVHTAVVAHALDVVYGAQALLAELKAGAQP